MRLLLLVLAAVFVTGTRAGEHAPPDKVLMVKVDDFGLIMVGRDTVGSDQLARYVQERLFKSYLGTGQMHDMILFQKTAVGIPEEVSEVVIREIKNGQEKALQVICLQKYRKTFAMLDAKKQARLKKQFPVLFQDSFTENV